MTTISTGGCLCGAVTFRISGTFDRFFLCHCSRCRKATGSAHASNMFSTTASIEWLTGEDRIRTYQLPETRFRKSFCADCGAALPTEVADVPLLKVPAGCLDTPVDIRPLAHICCTSRANWDDRLDEVTELDGMPGPAVPPATPG